MKVTKRNTVKIDPSKVEAIANMSMRDRARISIKEAIELAKSGIFLF